MNRNPIAVLVLLLALGACGSEDSSQPSQADRARLSHAVRAFARAVDPQANPARLCKLLVGEARRHQGCGTEGEDIGPLLQLAIDSERDIRVVKVVGDEAVAQIPSIALGPDHPKGTSPPQVLRLRRIDGQWKFTRLELSEPRNSATLGKATFTRDCESRVEGGTLKPNARTDVIAGPLILYGLRDAARIPAPMLRGRRGRFRPWKAVTEVAHDHEVTLAIPPRFRKRVALLYRFGGGTRLGYKLSEGDPAVRFKPCAPNEPRRSGRGTVGPRTQFNGGFVVAGPTCVELHVAMAGRVRDIRRRVSFGTHRRRC
jgi:hypothetical protein